MRTGEARDFYVTFAGRTNEADWFTYVTTRLVDDDASHQARAEVKHQRSRHKQQTSSGTGPPCQ